MLASLNNNANPSLEQATRALKETFSRLDATQCGSLGRDEYDLLMMLTDGEKCDDETWEYITGAPRHSSVVVVFFRLSA